MKKINSDIVANVLVTSMLIALNGWSCQAFASRTQATDKANLPTIQTNLRWEEFRAPNLDPASQSHLTTDKPDMEWWRNFHDPYLEGYISTALQNSPNLHITMAKVAEARAAFHHSISEELPTANLTASYYHVILPKLFGSALPKNLDIWTVPFQASYELDLYGKALDQTKASKRLWEASKQDYRAAQLSLCGDVAGAYFNLLRSDALVNSQQRNLALLSRIYDLKQSQYKIGLTSYDEVIRSDRDLAQAQTNLNTYQQQQALYAHQLAILTGSPPSTQEKMQRGTLETTTLPNQISAGTPADVLARRPDIQAAEKRLESARLNVRAARKAFLPTINLSSGLFLAGTSLSQLFNWNNHAAMLSGGVSQKLTGLYGLTADLNTQKARQTQQLEQYRQVTLNALKEVEDNLALLRTDYQSMDSNAKRRDLTQHDLNLNQNLYQQGLLPHLNVLQGQSELIQYEQLVAQSKVDTAIAVVNLYKALGGGF